MRTLILTLIVLFVSIPIYSQEVKSEYKFKSEKTKTRFLSGVKWNYIELDSLILYNDNTFYRKRFYPLLIFFLFFLLSEVDIINWVISSNATEPKRLRK